MKPRYKVDKRQKELARKQKQQRKLEEKLRRQQAEGTGVVQTAEAGPVDDADETDDAAAAGDDAEQEQNVG